jgi:hypothetical protein
MVVLFRNYKDSNPPPRARLVLVAVVVAVVSKMVLTADQVSWLFVMWAHKKVLAGK